MVLCSSFQLVALECSRLLAWSTISPDQDHSSMCLTAQPLHNPLHNQDSPFA